MKTKTKVTMTGAMVIMVLMIVMLLLNSSFAKAITEEESNEAKNLIESKVDCKALSDSQLEIIGESEMEQMHPGESHQLMHQMMGLKEGSDEEKQFHINLARTIYCNNGFGSGMLGMMGNKGYGMMGDYFGNGINQGFSLNLGNILWFLLLLGIIVLIFLLIYKFLIQQGSETPIVILRKRYSKGDISEKQFKEMKKEIGE